MPDVNTHQAIIQLIVAYTLAGAFVFTVAFTLIGLAIRINDPKYFAALFSALILELVAVCIAFFNGFINFNAKAVQVEVQAPLVEKVTAAQANLEQVGALRDEVSSNLSKVAPETEAQLESVVKRINKILPPTSTPSGPMRLPIHGKVDIFGGPDDLGMRPDEGLALVRVSDLDSPAFRDYFLPTQPPGTSGLARRLNPKAFYIGCRWDYTQVSRDELRRSLVKVTNPKTGKSEYAKPVDWAPLSVTGRSASISPGLASALGVQTNDEVEVSLESRESG